MYSFALVLLRPVQYPPPPFARLCRHHRAVSPDIALLGTSETQLSSLSLPLSRAAGLRNNKFHRAYLPRHVIHCVAGLLMPGCTRLLMFRGKPPKWIFVTFCSVTIVVPRGAPPVVFRLWDICTPVTVRGYAKCNPGKRYPNAR